METKIDVEVNFPNDMSIIEAKLGEIFGEMIIKRYGVEKSKIIAKEVQKRLKNKKD